MVKILILIILSTILYGDLKTSCLNCHKKLQIPDEMIYKRYLLKYSTKKNIENAMFSYLLKPDKQYSIMPALFFSKFPMKNKIYEDKIILKINIRKYIDKYNIINKLSY